MTLRSKGQGSRSRRNKCAGNRSLWAKADSTRVLRRVLVSFMLFSSFVVFRRLLQAISIIILC